MRVGSNPEKFKRELTRVWLHRVIIPVYIPNSEEEFYKESFVVFKKCINSLLTTINSNQTAITIINNNCSDEVSYYIEDLLSKDNIQKHIKYSRNVGKTYAILSEAKSCYEDFITISDADVYFIKGWVEETAKIFNNYKYVGMVSPIPSPAAYKFLNRPGIIRNLYKIKLDNVVDKYDFDLFEKGVNPPQNYFVGKKWNWKEKQFYLQNNNIKACLGSVHFIATYKKNIFEKIPLVATKYVFKGGDESSFIESYIESMNQVRLSTIKSFAYHMGNKNEDDLTLQSIGYYDKSFFNKKDDRIIISSMFFFLNKFLFYIISRLYRN